MPSPAPELRVDTDRLWRDVLALGELTDPHLPYTRRAFSPLFLKGREWLARSFTEAGLTTRIDAAGNLIGRHPGRRADAGVLMTGSHSDTVAGGGRFDGIAGVLVGLEVARALRDSRVELDHALEVVDFLAEEPNDFGLSCVGSRGMVGALSEAMLAFQAPAPSETLPDRTLAQAIQRMGGSPARLVEAMRSDVRAFFELHIEQGPVLESEGTDIGVVTAIARIRRVELTFIGDTDHVGTTPMALRRDAAAAAAEVMVWVRREAERLARSGQGHFVATTGVVEIQPNAVNVVPRFARLRIDIRSERPALLDAFFQQLDQASRKVAGELRVTRESLQILSDGNPAECDPELRRLIGACAAELGYSVRELASGAGHDAAFLSRIAPSAMVFVPCLKGKSHGHQEWAAPEALAKGANVLGAALIQRDRWV